MTDFWQRLATAQLDLPLQIAVDPEGVPVFLGLDEWRHILHGHPEMNDFRDLIELAVTRPDSREPDRRVDVRRYYSRVPASRNISGRNLPLRVRVVVKYVKEQDGLKGYIRTAFLTR